MEKDCVSFQQTVTSWVSVEHEGFQETAAGVFAAFYMKMSGCSLGKRQKYLAGKVVVVVVVGREV